MKRFANKIWFIFLLLALTELCHARSHRRPEVIRNTETFADIPEKPIAVVIASYNNRAWVLKNLHSLFSQNYSNYRIIYVDDASPDGTADAVEQYVKSSKQEFRFTLIRNKERVGGMCNLYHAIHEQCKDEEIIANVDGDDWLAHNNVLKKLNQVYSSQEVWLTHGSLVEYPNGNSTWCIRIPGIIVQKNAFRQFRCPSHLKTFYAWLFKKINMEDLMYQGQFAPMAYDQAYMYYLLEMAGERHAFIPDVLYVYNVSNPINENKVNAQLQRDVEAYFRASTPYERLPSIERDETAIGM